MSKKNQGHPPKWIIQFFRWFCDPEIVEDIEGDLVECFNRHLVNDGIKKARWKFTRQVLLLFRPGIIKPIFTLHHNLSIMFRHNFLISWRNFRNNLGYNSLNILGLGVGLACVLLISLFIRFELSYDQFHEKYDRIFRIAKEDPDNFYLGSNRFAVTPAPLAQALENEFPEVESATQIRKVKALITKEDKHFFEDGMYATAHFFDVFTFMHLKGNLKTALEEPNSLVLTKSMARKYFGEEDPLGKSLSINIYDDTRTMEVTGVIEDVPANSHMDFDYLVSMTSFSQYHNDAAYWDNNNFYTYCALLPGYSLDQFMIKLSALAKKYLSQYSYYQEHPNEITNYYPQALSDIHLKSHINFEVGVNGDIKYIRLFAGIAILILLLGCINFINLSTARAILRFREVSTRKIIGAHRLELIGQFVSESLLPGLLATVLAFGLAMTTLPLLNLITQRQLDFNLTKHGDLIMYFLLIGLATGLSASLFPALKISGFKPMGSPTRTAPGRSNNFRLRNALVVFQFMITIPLIIATVVIFQQLDYIRNANTGLNRDQIVAVNLHDPESIKHFPTLKQELLSNPDIPLISASAHLPTRISSQSGTRKWEGAQEGEHISIYHMGVDSGFVNLLGIKLVKGHNFSNVNRNSDQYEFLINETLARQLDWKDPVGRWLELNDRKGLVVGVVKDFNFQSFHQQMAPLALYVEPGQWKNILVKVDPDKIPTTLAYLEKTFKDFEVKYPFEYQFLDDAYNRMYQNESRLGKLFSYFTILAIFIACLGLFGLAAFSASQRKKEIGIRKVLGASVHQIIILLNRDFIKLVITGFILALPISYLMMNRWLEDFAFKIKLEWWIFLIAGATGLLIAFISVSGQSLRAALSDPAKVIRHE